MRRSRQSTFLLATLIVVASTIVATAYILWRLRAETIDRHFEVASLYARAFEDHLTQSLNVIELTLANVGDQEIMNDTLAAALRHAPYLRSLAVLDRKGAIVASSNPRNVGVRVSQASFMPPTLEPRTILRVAPPWVGRDFHEARPTSPEEPANPDAQTLIPVLHDFELDQGHWVTLLASVNTDYFLNHYAQGIAADNGVVELLRYDGILLLSTDATRNPGIRDNEGMLADRMVKHEFGQFEEQFENGRAVLTAYRASQSFPFVIAVHLDKEGCLSEWRRETARALAIIAILLITTLALAGLYSRHVENAARQHDADEKQLRLLGAALEAAANSIIITDRNGTIAWANQAFSTLSGYTIDQTLGRNPRELCKSGKQSPDGYQDLWRTILAGKVWRGELINRRKDGTHYLEDQTITPVLDENGTIRHFIAVKQDITESRQREERMEELSRHLVVMQESARRRLSGELHDRTSPNLAAIAVNLDIMTTMAEGESSMFSARLADVRALLEDTTASIREICSELRPPVLDYAGLAEALESYVRQFQRRTGIMVQIDCARPAARLTPALESVLFRIVQEALTNCAKHSRAKSIELALSLDSQPIALTISDDGVGFDPELLGKTTHTGGLGILTMREMAEFSGGTLDLESIPGKGTRIKVEIAMEEQT